MTEKLRSVPKEVLIAGLENVRVDDADSLLKLIREKAHDVQFQLFDADSVAGRRHLEFAVLNAVKAFEYGNNISRSLTMEVLLYASAQRQIDKAFKMVGVTSKTRSMAVTVFVNQKENADATLKIIQRQTGGNLNDAVLEIHSMEKASKLIKTFSISDLEAETEKTANSKMENVLTELVLERVALLAVEQ